MDYCISLSHLRDLVHLFLYLCWKLFEMFCCLTFRSSVQGEPQLEPVRVLNLDFLQLFSQQDVFLSLAGQNNRSRLCSDAPPRWRNLTWLANSRWQTVGSWGSFMMAVMICSMGVIPAATPTLMHVFNKNRNTLTSAFIWDMKQRHDGFLNGWFHLTCPSSDHAQVFRLLYLSWRLFVLLDGKNSWAENYNGPSDRKVTFIWAPSTTCLLLLNWRWTWSHFKPLLFDPTRTSAVTWNSFSYQLLLVQLPSECGS